MRMKMAGLITMISILAAPHADAGVWTRVDAYTIKLEGDIEPGEYKRFSEVFREDTKEIIVNSGGGVTNEGIAIGFAMRHHPLKITVIGNCLSSCANYMFVAAAEREIRGGIVGFHGNVTACFTGARGDAAMLKIRDQAKAAYPQLTNPELDGLIADLMADNLNQSKFEQQLLAEVGISQELFDRSCQDDKGMGDGKLYSLLLPTEATFVKYGFKDIRGVQDPELVKLYGDQVVVD